MLTSENWNLLSSSPDASGVSVFTSLTKIITRTAATTRTAMYMYTTDSSASSRMTPSVLPPNTVVKMVRAILANTASISPFPPSRIPKNLPSSLGLASILTTFK